MKKLIANFPSFSSTMKYEPLVSFTNPMGRVSLNMDLRVARRSVFESSDMAAAHSSAAHGREKKAKNKDAATISRMAPPSIEYRRIARREDSFGRDEDGGAHNDRR